MHGGLVTKRQVSVLLGRSAFMPALSLGRSVHFLDPPFFGSRRDRAGISAGTSRVLAV